jgi:hydrogenase/urease accessory protein HupE
VKKLIIFLPLIMGIYSSSEAHVVVQELENMSKADASSTFLFLGFKHILPLGLDHILFVLSLFLLSPRLKPVLAQSAAFTVAHSITLGLSMYGIISPPLRIIEPLIAISIVYVALENIFTRKVKPTRIAIVFLFGLVHGMGFAGALNEIGLPPNAYLLSLVMFNIGVELGQVSLILIAYLLVARWYSARPYYQNRIVIPLSVVIALIAAFWTVERIFLS